MSKTDSIRSCWRGRCPNVAAGHARRRTGVRAQLVAGNHRPVRPRLAAWRLVARRADGGRAASCCPFDGSAAVVRTMQGGKSSRYVRHWKCPTHCGESAAVRATVLYSAPGTCGTRVRRSSAAGSAAGLVWAERPSGQPWTETEREYLALTAQDAGTIAGAGRSRRPGARPRTTVAAARATRP